MGGGDGVDLFNEVVDDGAAATAEVIVVVGIPAVACGGIV